MGCGIFVIISKNPIVSVLFLIGLFLNIAGYLMMLGMNFIGLSYLLVYVGAVSILFLFIFVFFNMTLYKLLPSNITSPNLFFLQKTEIGIEGDTINSGNITYPLTKPVNSLFNNDLSFVTSQI